MILTIKNFILNKHNFTRTVRVHVLKSLSAVFYKAYIYENHL